MALLRNTDCMVGVAGAAAKLAADFEVPMRNVNTMLRLNDEDFRKLEKNVLDLSRTLPQTGEQLAEGLFQLVSAGVPAEHVMEILRIAAEGASAGLATTEDASKALLAVIRGYNRPWSDAQEVMNKMFKAVEVGQLEFSELASSIGIVVPMAAALEVSLDEVLGATASLAGVTGSTSEVMTQLRAIMSAFLTPNEEMAKGIGRVADQLVVEGKLTGEMADRYMEARNQLQKTSDAIAAYVAKQQKGITLTKAETQALKDLNKDQTEREKAVKEAAKSLGPLIVQTLGLRGALQLLDQAAAGDKVNLEIDMLARYVARLLDRK